MYPPDEFVVSMKLIRVVLDQPNTYSAECQYARSGAKKMAEGRKNS
jgi:hypothetical protein